MPSSISLHSNTEMTKRCIIPFASKSFVSSGLLVNLFSLPLPLDLPHMCFQNSDTKTTIPHPKTTLLCPTSPDFPASASPPQPQPLAPKMSPARPASVPHSTSRDLQSTGYHHCSESSRMYCSRCNRIDTEYPALGQGLRQEARSSADLEFAIDSS